MTSINKLPRSESKQSSAPFSGGQDADGRQWSAKKGINETAPELIQHISLFTR